MVINELDITNLPAFHKCFDSLMREGYGQFPQSLREHFMTKEYTMENFSFWLSRNLRKVLLAYDDSQIIGFLVGDHTYGGVAFISWLGVLPEYRGKGIGKKLLAEYERYISQKDAHLIELNTFDSVKGFYEKLGFTEIGRRPRGYFSMKNVIMDKPIGDARILLDSEGEETIPFEQYEAHRNSKVSK